MSLSLTRRIAQAALLVAVGAAPVVAAAGSATAAELPTAGNLGGVSKIDGAALGSTVDNASTRTTAMAGRTGGKAVETAVPAAGRAVGATGRAVAPAAQKTAGTTADHATRTLGSTARSAGHVLSGTTRSVRGSSLPVGASLPSAGLPSSMDTTLPLHN
jgi:hypothetical protein